MKWSVTRLCLFYPFFTLVMLVCGVVVDNDVQVQLPGSVLLYHLYKE